MNIFRSLIGRVWQDPNATEVVKISTGQLYLVRPGNIRSSRECIYNDAMATIRRVPGVDHNFQLVITRVYEEGDQELLEDEEETDEERVCLISEELEFRTGKTDGEPHFVWRDLDGDVDEFYEYVATGTNEPTRAFFETCMYRAMYERKYRQSADHTQDSDFEEFFYKPPTQKAKSTPRRKVSGKSEATPARSPPRSEASASKQVTPKKPAAPRTVLFQSSYPAIVEQPAELYLWDGPNEDFIPQGNVIARIVQRPGNGFEYWMLSSNEQGDLLAHRISSEMNQRWSHKMLSLTWNYIQADGSGQSWLFRFLEEDTFGAFLQMFTQCLWESLHQSPWGKAKADEQNYAISANEDVEMLDVENEDDDEDEVLSELDPDAEASDDEEEEEEDGDVPEGLPTGERNSQLTVGYKGDRSYVVRGSNIGVFSHTVDNGVKYHATISKLATPKGKEFKPKQVMLHDQDTKMIIMNPTDPNSLFSMDIERGKIVEEWKVHDDITVDHITPENKFAPTTREQTLVGISHNSLFRIDPRVSGTKLVESQFKQYISKNKFSGVTTTAQGKLAVASEKGDIRLFDSIGKNAKTALPPLGDPIIGIDVTADGRWVVATTKTYLLLIDTKIGDGRYAGSLGFDRSFPANAKPIPRRLQLRSEHVAYMGHNVSFTPARFNQGKDQEENAIITSTGQFVVAWDFAKVKKGRLDVYEIKKYEDYVVQDNFKFGDDKEIIVALQNNVLAINKKNLKKPTRHSLGGAGPGPSRSSIVNAPY
ncbi:VID27-domain-containing protein [Pluteus cervinus]|uniref:VID27-domain-containing protein n=1 Tax=Pluteus cervinus TaxID=181527 RepID=A0ACD3BD38_9AGAR|nr:VID27-domain-containing protein [Pluteus cervinus]